MNRKPYPGAPLTRRFGVHAPLHVSGRPPFAERWFRRVMKSFEKLSSTAQIAVGGAAIAIVFAMDLATGPQASFSVFYLIPISLFAWSRGWAAARIVIVLCTVAWFFGHLMGGNRYSMPVIRFWNAGVLLCFFLIVAYILALLRRSLEEQVKLARTDSLTGVGNSRWFYEIMAKEIARGKRYNHPLSIAFLDCDNFKEVNDRHGHAAGDELLKEIAARLESVVREVDVVARLGGDEFAILLPETDERAASTVHGKVREALRSTTTTQAVTFSIGLVTYYRPPKDVEELFDSVDEAMYEAKKSGKNTSSHKIISDEMQGKPGRTGI